MAEKNRFLQKYYQNDQALDCLRYSDSEHKAGYAQNLCEYLIHQEILIFFFYSTSNSNHTFLKRKSLWN